MRIPGAAVLLLVVAHFGCGSDGPQVVRVNGTLSHKGKPVPSALLNFLPDKGRQSWAVTDENGRFKINYDKHQDGAVVGKHQVWIEYRANTDAEKEAALEGRPAPLSAQMKAFFEKYSHGNSKLEVKIDSGTSELKLDLD
ncbi:MAG: hypothetical protein L0215_13795 [Gemmataceae bacterium]|nr:hypothetical protein [Gemmataceae bacterium]